MKNLPSIVPSSSSFYWVAIREPPIFGAPNRPPKLDGLAAASSLVLFSLLLFQQKGKELPNVEWFLADHPVLGGPSLAAQKEKVAAPLFFLL